jgi:hypothetical protein
MPRTLRESPTSPRHLGAFFIVSHRSVPEEAGDAVDRLLDVGDRVGVREANVAFALIAEAGAGHQRDPGLVQQLVLQLARGVAGAGDVGKRIEGAARAHAAKTRERVQALEDHPAPVVECGHHPLDRVLRPS